MDLSDHQSLSIEKRKVTELKGNIKLSANITLVTSSACLYCYNCRPSSSLIRLYYQGSSVVSLIKGTLFMPPINHIQRPIPREVAGWGHGPSPLGELSDFIVKHKSVR